MRSVSGMKKFTLCMAACMILGLGLTGCGDSSASKSAGAKDDGLVLLYTHHSVYGYTLTEDTDADKYFAEGNAAGGVKALLDKDKVFINGTAIPKYGEETPVAGTQHVQVYTNHVYLHGQKVMDINGQPSLILLDAGQSIDVTLLDGTPVHMPVPAGWRWQAHPAVAGMLPDGTAESFETARLNLINGAAQMNGDTVELWGKDGIATEIRARIHDFMQVESITRNGDKTELVVYEKDDPVALAKIAGTTFLTANVDPNIQADDFAMSWYDANVGKEGNWHFQRVTNSTTGFLRNIIDNRTAAQVAARNNIDVNKVYEIDDGNGNSKFVRESLVNRNSIVTMTRPSQFRYAFYDVTNLSSLLKVTLWNTDEGMAFATTVAAPEVEVGGKPSAGGVMLNNNGSGSIAVTLGEGLNGEVLDYRLFEYQINSGSGWSALAPLTTVIGKNLSGNVQVRIRTAQMANTGNEPADGPILPSLWTTASFKF